MNKHHETQEKRSVGEWVADVFSLTANGGVRRRHLLLGFLAVRSLARNLLTRTAALPVKVFGFIALKLLAFMRRRWAARPKRTLEDWIALTIARAFSFAIVGGLVYVTYIVEMTSYDDFRNCSKTSTITRFEWVLGVRPAEDCRRSY